MRHIILKLAGLASVAWLGACSPKPAAVAIKRLSFPVILVVGTAASGAIPSRAEVVHNPLDLSRMRVALYSTLTDATLSDAPIVIDATASEFEMRDLVGEHGNTWMLLNPNGVMPIRFSLVQRAESDIRAARAVLEACKYLGSDLDTERTALRRARIRHAKNMAELVQIVDEIPSSQQLGVPDHSNPARLTAK